MKNEDNTLQVELRKYEESTFNSEYDFDRIIYDLNSQIELLASQADKYDYLVSISSGLLCGLLDILWVGNFSLERGRDMSCEKIDSFVTKTAKLLGYNGDELKGAVKFLESKFSIPSDGNTPHFGGSLQHHLRDFAHHPTLVGLIFSLLTQFTYKSYGTDVNGAFIIVDVPEKSRAFIGSDIPSKIIFGTVYWFFHLVSDLAGSNSSVGKSGGTGIPGPFLSLAKELSVLPLFKNINVNEYSISVFLSKLFNGTLLAKRDDTGKIIKDTVLKFDLRSELGIGIELGRQAIPVVANECTVRCFYFIRRLAVEIRKQNTKTIADLKKIDWSMVKPYNNPTISRMLTIATGIFTAVDVGEAVITQKYWLSINFAGVGRFAVAIGEDISWCLKSRNIKNIKIIYENIRKSTYTHADERIYERIGSDMDMEKFKLTIDQIEILYNLEYYKTLNDIRNTKNEIIKRIKQEWLDEWKEYITKGFSSFLQIQNAEIHWFTEQELIQIIEQNDPYDVWFRLVLLEVMLFEPYYPLSTEKNKKGNDVPSKKHKILNNPIYGYSQKIGDEFIDSFFTGDYYKKGYINRLRKCYRKVVLEMKEVTRGILIGGAITVGITIVTIATAGAFAPSIAVALVGSNFAGLKGAALTSACLAYLGGGAIAAGGAGMAGGTFAIVAGGAILGLGTGLGIGGAVGAAELLGKQNTILQSAKLMVSVREIFLNDEHDVEYSNTIYEQFVKNIVDIEKYIVELKLKAEEASVEDKKKLNENIKRAEESVKAMKIARKSLKKFISSFREGLSHS